jgi:hypothetical protein
MPDNTQTVRVQSEYKDGLSEGLKANKRELQEVESTVKGMDPVEQAWRKRVEDVSTSIRSQVGDLKARATALRDPATQDAIAHTRHLQEEIESLTRTFRSEDAIVRDLNNSMTESLSRLDAQKRVLADPGFVGALREQQRLKGEINALTKAAVGELESETGAIQLNARSRRELIVLGHELVQGNFKAFGSSLMVLEEGNGGITGALKAATKAITETIGVAGMAAIAIGALGLAAYEVREHYIKLSEAQAENYHKMDELGERTGMTAEEMRGLQYATVGTSVTAEELSRAIAMLSVRMQEHSEEFVKLGVTSKEPLKAFEQLIDVANRAGSEAERNRILNEGLGESWQKIVPFVKMGGEAIEEAIQKGKLPEDVKADYESIITYQKLMKQAEIEADQASAEHASHMASHAAKMNAAAAMMKASHGAILGTLMWWGDQALAGMSEGDNTTFGEGMVDAAAKKLSAKKEAQKKTGSEIETLTDAQQTALDWARKQNAKSSLESELADIRKEFESKASLFAVKSENYRVIMDQELAKEAEIRKKWAKKNAPKAAKESDWSKADTSFESAYGFSYDAYKMTSPSGVNDERDTGTLSKSQKKKREKGAEDEAKELAQFLKQQADMEQRDRLDDRAHALKVEKQKTADLKNESDERKKIQQGVFDSFGAGLEDQIFLIEKGKASWTQFDEVLINAGERAIARLIAQTAASALQAALTGEAWKEPAMLASIASFGAADVAGVAGYQTAMSSTSVFRARGGQVDRGFIGNEDAGSGGEYFETNTPGRIFNSTQQTTNNVGGATFHIYAGARASADDIASAVAKVLPRSGRLAKARRSQTSRSRG